MPWTSIETRFHSALCGQICRDSKKDFCCNPVNFQALTGWYLNLLRGLGRHTATHYSKDCNTLQHGLQQSDIWIYCEARTGTLQRRLQHTATQTATEWYLNLLRGLCRPSIQNLRDSHALRNILKSSLHILNLAPSWLLRISGNLSATVHALV